MLRPRDFPDTRPSLLGALRDGRLRQPAWREFFERYAPAVYRVARMRGLGPHDADDIVQQVMMAIARHISGFHYDRNRGYFRQWVRRIAESKICNLHRRQRPAACDADLLDDRADEQPSVEDLWLQEWRVQDLLWCLDQIAADISPRRVRAFRMYALEGVSAAQTAEALDMSVGYVYVTRNQVLNLLCRRMKELEGDSQSAAPRRGDNDV